VSHNDISYGGWHTTATAGGHGITAWSDDENGGVGDAVPHDNIYEYNEVSYTEVAADGTEGNGLQFDGLVESCIMRYNISHHNEGNGFLDHGDGNGNNQCYYNIAYKNGRAGFDIYNCPNSLTYNCVAYDNDTYGIWIEGDGASDAVVKNCICAENGGDTEFLVSGNVSGTPTIDYNCVYHSGGGTFMDWKGTDYNWADWKTNSSQDAHSINDNPDMINPGSQLFSLQGVSPCIGTGVDVSLTEDYIGNTVPINTTFDIGAYEYIGLPMTTQDVTSSVIAPSVAVGVAISVTTQDVTSSVVTPSVATGVSLAMTTQDITSSVVAPSVAVGVTLSMTTQAGTFSVIAPSASTETNVTSGLGMNLSLKLYLQ